MRQYLDLIGTLAGRQRAALILSAMAGALMMARAVTDEDLSTGLLSIVAEGLPAQ